MAYKPNQNKKFNPAENKSAGKEGDNGRERERNDETSDAGRLRGDDNARKVQTIH